jgi:queuine/archaeosine tRNA-ribosyltransferase
MTADNVASSAADILKLWTVNPDFKIKDLTQEQYQDQQVRLARLLSDIKAKEDELTPLRNERDDLMKKLNENTTRARSGIKGYFGADSSEYELAGGTRSSERKKPAARAKAVAAVK